MSNLYGRPTAAELVAAVAEFLDTEVRDSESVAAPVKFQARVAANALRMVERELLASGAPAVAAALAEVGFRNETDLAAAIRAGELDDRADDVTDCLRVLVRHRLAAAHPGYDEP
ncbi:DUF6285 domain-containing protein [Mycolicibacterium fortuitum]|uniref:DUF6285 domain-containing protein n=1 Tax=Mycolicibacterium fortuitum TaxID=1766 RepID=UPI000D6CB4BC|nr:DUF6285 domain-containing protein [Mycolicibacterium fortuitum]